VASRAADAGDARALAQVIDRMMAARWDAAGVKPAPLADDAEFLRRVTLDIAGRIPTVAEARAFLADTSPNKREKLVERLLDGPAHVNNVTNLWKGLLLPEDNASNFQLRFFVPAFEAWLRKQFGDNVPYDRIVRELLTAPLGGDARSPREVFRPGATVEPSPLAFYIAKDAKPEELAAATSRLFLGVKIECAQCHNHPFARWSRQQFWEYAAFFAGIEKRGQGFFAPMQEKIDRRELAIPNTSQVVQAMFLDGNEPAWKYKVGPRTTLAEWLTSPRNPYFARAAVNRLWGHFFGRGLVEPVDDLNDQNPPSHPEVLDELARQFAAHGFDQKFVIRAITLTQAYQLTSVRTDPSQDEPRLFARMAVKGLSGEQLFDSLVTATGFREVRTPQDPFIFNPSSPRIEFLTRFADQDSRTESQTSILQALALMNGKFVADATNLQKSETLAAIADAPFLDTAGRVETLYLATVSRMPRPDERDRMVRYVESGGPRKDPKAALADVLWVLLNSPEFILNH
jgi:hypothetical protein